MRRTHATSTLARGAMPLTGVLSLILSLALIIRPARAVGDPAAGDTLQLDLSEAYRIARHGSWQVKAADARLERAEGNRITAHEAFLPSISPVFRFVTHRDRLQNTEGEFLDVDKQSARTGASLFLAWRPSEIVFRRAAANSEVQAAEASGVATERDVLWETARRYVDLAAAEETVRIAERTLATLQDLEGQIAARVRLGLSSEVDRLRVLNQVERQRADLVRAGAARQAATGQLCFALGFATPRALRTSGFPAVSIADTSLPAAIDEALARRSDLAAARAAASAARHERSSWTYGRLLPDLGAEVSPGLLGPTFGSGEKSFDASVYLSWNIGPGGLVDVGRMRTAKAVATLADVRVQELQSQIAAEVYEAYAAARAAAELEAASARSAEAAESVLRLSVERDQRGISVAYELVQSTDAWLRSLRELTLSRAEAALARVRLELVLQRYDGPGR